MRIISTLNLKRVVKDVRTVCGAWIAMPRKCCDADLVKCVPLLMQLATLPTPSRICPRILSSSVIYSSLQLSGKRSVAVEPREDAYWLGI